MCRFFHGAPPRRGARSPSGRRADDPPWMRLNGASRRAAGGAERRSEMGNPVVHFDISGPDAAALQSFYGELFGWAVTSLPEMEYALVDTQAGSGINGGIGTSRDGNGGVTFYVFSEDLQASLDKAESLGGRTTQPVTVIPGTVTLAMF